MSLNLSAHFQRNTPKQSSTITNQIVVNPSSAHSIVSESSSVQPISVSEPTIPTVFSSPYPDLQQSPKISASAPSLSNDDKINTFKLILLEILERLFSSEISMLNNIIEPSKSIILKVEDLYRLISVLCDTQSVDIICSPVIKGCACSSKILYANIDSIVVNGYDLMIAYNSAFNTLESQYLKYNNPPQVLE
jgi:hypothetical protein